MPRNYRRAAFIAVSMGVFCIELDSFALNLALPSIAEELPPSPMGLRWVVSGYLLSVGTLMLGAGRLSDRYGRRNVLLLGLCLFAIASALCATAPTLSLLIAARVVQGVGGALLMPSGLALLTEVFPAETRGKVIGWALGIGGVAMVCGPFAGGVLTQWASWRAVFWLNVPLAALAAVCACRTRRARQLGVKPDLAGLVMVTGALGFLAVLVDRAPLWGWSPATAGTLVVFLGLVGVIIHHERTAAAPLIDRTPLHSTRYIALTAVGSVANTATVVFLFVIPLLLHGTYGLSPGTSGVAFLVPTILMSGAATVAGRVPTDRAIPAMSACLGGAAAALVTIAALFAHGTPVGTQVSTLPAVLVATGACGATLGLAKALTLIATQAVVPPEHAGAASGLTKTAVTMSAGLGMASTTSDFGLDLVFAGVACAVASALLPTLALHSGPRRQHDRSTVG